MHAQTCTYILNIFKNYNLYHQLFIEINCFYCLEKEHPDDTIQVRLVNGKDAHEGRVEILYAGVWGAICNDLFNLTAANVVCRQLGYPGAVRIASSFGSDSAQIWLDDVQCIGNESSIVQCSHNGFNIYNCNFDTDQIGVECIGQLKCECTCVYIIHIYIYIYIS